jgi:hypothetical protein
MFLKPIELRQPSVEYGNAPVSKAEERHQMMNAKLINSGRICESRSEHDGQTDEYNCQCDE